ncbi:hypothetical protein MtrunA17_Chr5g0431611 [Medicago truncatula]|uniref:Transmembrane protein n=1 Tax=Medicago truncatula TaxID=3880 RepID=A0A396I1B4_MEDTR|nr:hypothetical protein MtrunA17_Chr5g0431611 [Medicago truncatula]
MKVSNCFIADKHSRFSETWRDFCWHNGWFLLKQIVARFCAGVTRFVDKVVVPWVVRFNRGAIFTGAARFLSVTVYYLSVSSHFLRKRRENFKRGKLGKSKEVTLGLRVFD